MPDDSNSFALEFRLRKLDRGLHTRFTDCVFALQKILSNYKLLFPEYTDHSRLTAGNSINLARIAHAFGDQFATALFRYGNIVFFKGLIVYV